MCITVRAIHRSIWQNGISSMQSVSTQIGGSSVHLSLLTTHRQIVFSLSLFVQVEIPVTSHPQKISSWLIRSSLCGDSKWIIILPQKPARVLWPSWSISPRRVDRVLCIHWMEQSPLSSMSRVPTGPIKTTSTTIHSTVCSLDGEERVRGRADLSACVVAWSSDLSQRTLIAFSSISAFQVQLPRGEDPTFSLQLIVYIRDSLGSITEHNLTSVVVFADPSVVTDLINDLQYSPDQLQNHPSIRSLLTQNQNRVGQVITSLSQQLNQLNNEQIDLAASSSCIFKRDLSRITFRVPRWCSHDKYLHFTFGNSTIVDVGGREYQIFDLIHITLHLSLSTRSPLQWIAVH